MADTFIQLPADSTGKKVDTRTEGTNAEHREVHVVGDPSTNEGVAVVSNVDVTGERYGLVVRDPNSTTIAIPMQTLGSGEANANTLRVITATDAIASVNVVGSITQNVTITGATVTIAALYTRQVNPTALAADYVQMGADDLGRQLIRPHQVRDLVATAYVSITGGTETTLLAAGGAGVYLDLMMITATNNSTAAVQLDIRATTAGSIIHTMYLPASTGPVGWVPPVPWPQDNVNNNWTIDMPDISGTTVYVSALFSKEV